MRRFLLLNELTKKYTGLKVLTGPTEGTAVGNVLCQKFNVYSYGKNKLYLNLYFIAVSLCGSLGLSLLCQGSPLSAVVFGLGCFCYFASDMFLGLFLFKFRNRVIDSVNSLLYFPGMLLVAIGLLL